VPWLQEGGQDWLAGSASMVHVVCVCVLCGVCVCGVCVCGVVCVMKGTWLLETC
jgi:hypothetical protein